MTAVSLGYSGLPWAPSPDKLPDYPFYAEFYQDSDDFEFHLNAMGDPFLGSKMAGWLDDYNGAATVDYKFVDNSVLCDSGFPTVPVGDYRTVGWMKRKPWDGNFAMMSRSEDDHGKPWNSNFHAPLYRYMQATYQDHPFPSTWPPPCSDYDGPVCPDIPELNAAFMFLLSPLLLLRRKRHT